MRYFPPSLFLGNGYLWPIPSGSLKISGGGDRYEKFLCGSFPTLICRGGSLGITWRSSGLQQLANGKTSDRCAGSQLVRSLFILGHDGLFSQRIVCCSTDLIPQKKQNQNQYFLNKL